MKKFGLLFASALALVALAACSDDENEIEPETGYDDAYYAAQASISSDDSSFSLTSEGATVSFKTEGGQVIVNVDCGTDWTAENHATDIVDSNVNLSTGTLTLTADQNTIEEELTGEVILMTANEGITFATITVTQNAYGAPEITVETNEWHAPAVGALTTEIGVEASDDWSIENTADWLTAEKTDTGVKLTASENEETEERTAEIVLTCTDGISTDSETITVTQDAKAYISLSTEKLEIYADEGTYSVTVESNFDWDYSHDTSNGWFTIDKSGDSLTVDVKENETGKEREGTVTVTTGDGAENIAEIELTITQSVFQLGSLVLEYTVTSDGTKIQLPLSETDGYYNRYTIDCTVDWGDGSTVESVTGSFPSHTYSTGTYNVIINGKVELLESYDYNYYDEIGGAECLTAVIQWGDTGLKSMDSAFYGCENLTSLPEGAGPFSNVTTFLYAFGRCYSLTTVPENLFSNCAAAPDFEYTFYLCTSLTSVPSFKGLSKVTDFYATFCYCYALMSVPEDIFSGCTAAKDFTYAFYDCTSLNTLPQNMFSSCTSATGFNSAFYGCTSLTAVPENLFSGCTAAENFGWVFGECTSLTTVPENLFSDCKSAKYLWDIFCSCTSLNSVPEKLFANCTAAEDFGYTFCYCSSLTSVPENLFANCPSTLYFNGLFYGCPSLITVPSGIFDNNNSVTWFEEAFYDCSSMKGESPYTMIEGNKVHLYERANYSKYFTAPTNYSNCFTGCTNLDDYSSIPSNWGGKGSSPNSVTPQRLNAATMGEGPGLQRNTMGPGNSRK